MRWWETKPTCYSYQLWGTFTSREISKNVGIHRSEINWSNDEDTGCFADVNINGTVL